MLHAYLPNIQGWDQVFLKHRMPSQRSRNGPSITHELYMLGRLTGCVALGTLNCRLTAIIL